MPVFRSALLAVASALLATVPALSAPTPIPGGANQVGGVSGKVGDQLFNGVVRLQVVELRDATPADSPDVQQLVSADKRAMLMTVIVRNGLHTNFIDLLRYSLADKDDVSYVIEDYRIKPNPLNIPQAAAARQTAIFPVDKNFMPVKLLVQCATCSKQSRFVAFRVTVPPPAAAPAAAPAASP
jgi:hypothetical protein